MRSLHWSKAIEGEVPGDCLVRLVWLALLIFFVGCSGNPSAPPTPLVIAPAQASVIQGGTQSFAATGGATSVKWTVEEGSIGGMINNLGLYTAPNNPGTFHIMAASTSDTRSQGIAVVTVPAVTITSTENDVGVTTGATTNLSNIVSVSGTIYTGLTWSVQEGAAGGSVTSAGFYTAPNSPGAYHVLVQSLANSQAQGSITVTVSLPAVTISPSTDVLGPFGVRYFYGYSTAVNPALSWSIPEGASGGTLVIDSSTAQYIASNATGTYHVTAASVSDLTLTATASITVVPSGFRPSANSMNDQRTGPTATLLPDGTVLIAGGDACLFQDFEYCPLSTAEIYDPATDSFAKLPATMSSTREFHTATLLQSGKVLIVGGSSAIAELYDPATKTFSNTGTMLVGRSSHTATLLPNGKVLIVGGTDFSGSPTSSAELYDPAQGSFSAVGSMAASRTDHAATALPDGTVLISGGWNGTEALATAEIFNPATGSFIGSVSMTVARASHTATLLSNGKVLLTGGVSSDAETSSAEIFDPTTEHFTATQNMLAARSSHVAILLPDGTVEISSGYVTGGEDYESEVYDPMTGTFRQTGSMVTGRVFPAVTLLRDGRVLMVGGSDLNSVEIYQ